MIQLLKFLRPYTNTVVAVLTLLFFQSLGELYLPTLMADIVDKGIVNGDTRYIISIGGLMLLVAALGTSCSIGAVFLSSKMATAFSRDLRGKVFSRVESYSLHEFDKIGTASLITRTTNDINQVQQVMIMGLRMMVSAPMMCIGGIIMAVSKDAKLSLIFVVVIPVLAVLIFSVARKGLPLFKVMQGKLDKLNLVLRENLIGIRAIRAFNRIDHEKKRFNDANRDLADNAIRVNKIMAAIMPMMMLVMNFMTIAIIWFGSIRIDNGNMQVGDMMAFIQYAMQIMFSLIMVSMMFVMIPRASASDEEIRHAAETAQAMDFIATMKDGFESVLAQGGKMYLEDRSSGWPLPGH